MFRDLTKLQVDDSGVLVDNRGIKHKRAHPVVTIDSKLYGRPYISETHVSVFEYLNLTRKLCDLQPQPNAWLDAEVLDEGTEVLKFSDINLDGSILTESREVSYKIHRLEFYHLGE